jgi:hypothetical protein
MRNVSGYLTDDGKFFQDKKEAEAHERTNAMNQHIENFIRINHSGNNEGVFGEMLRKWEAYRKDVLK